MNRKINDLIPKAITAVETNLWDNQNKHIPKEYKGYISSFGASIIQTGLLATIAFYQKDPRNETGVKRSNILSAILDLIIPKDRSNNHQKKNALMIYVLEQTLKKNTNDSITDVSITNIDKEKMLTMERDIKNALIALKLALRTFKIEEK